MSEKLEAIKELQEELFVEEYGVTKEQARKLNEFIFYEPTGTFFDGYLCREIPNPSVNALINRLEKRIENQNEELSELQWEHKKLWMGFWAYVAISAIAIAVIIRELS